MSSSAAAASSTAELGAGVVHARSPIKTTFAAVARYRNSQRLDHDQRISVLIQANRRKFDAFVKELAHELEEAQVPDGPEVTRAVELLEMAKDSVGRALIHGIGKVDGVPFEQAVRESTTANRA